MNIKAYIYWEGSDRILLIELDDAHDIPDLILSALDDMKADGLLTVTGYRDIKGHIKRFAEAPPHIKQSFKKYVIRAIDETSRTMTYYRSIIT